MHGLQKLVCKKYPLLHGLQASNMQCAHTETFTLAHMLHESQSIDVSSVDVIPIPVEAQCLVDQGKKKCHTVRFLGMHAAMRPQHVYQAEVVEKALLKCAEMQQLLPEVRQSSHAAC